MPILDLKCLDCGNLWEDLVGATTPDCPKCQSPLVERLITRGPTVLGSAQERIKNRANNPQTEPVSVYIRRDK